MIQVIGRVFQILEELSLDGEVSLEGLSRVTSLNKGTLCNILRSMIELGYVKRSRCGHYRIGEKLRDLAGGGQSDSSALDKIRAAVRALADSTRESGVIATLRGTRVSILAQAQFQRSLMINTAEIYAALSLYHSVSGRILVACLSPENRAGAVREAGLPGGLWDGIDSMEKLEEACAVIRREGISVMENPDMEIISFAVPVRYPSGENAVSMGLTVPLARCRASDRKKVIALLRENAENLESQLLNPEDISAQYSPDGGKPCFHP